MKGISEPIKRYDFDEKVVPKLEERQRKTQKRPELP